MRAHTCALSCAYIPYVHVRDMCELFELKKREREITDWCNEETVYTCILEARKELK